MSLASLSGLLERDEKRVVKIRISSDLPHQWLLEENEVLANSMTESNY